MAVIIFLLIFALVSFKLNKWRTYYEHQFRY